MSVRPHTYRVGNRWIGREVRVDEGGPRTTGIFLGPQARLPLAVQEMALVLEAVKSAERDTPDYIEANHDKMSAKFVRSPKLADVPYAAQMQPHLIVEFYSR